MTRTEKYKTKLEKIKTLSNESNFRTQSALIKSLKIDSVLISKLTNNKILKLDSNCYLKWNDKIPVTANLSQKIISLVDSHYYDLKSRQGRQLNQTRKTKKKLHKKVSNDKNVLVRIWKAIFNN
jgi:hypothetical protein